MYQISKFNEPYLEKKIYKYIDSLIKSKNIGNYGKFTKLAENKLKKIYPKSYPILTHSCTAALEICALLLNIKKGDEIIMPSFTFSSTANAFVLRGAKIVYADIKIQDCNIDEKKIENLITKKTVAILVVHYAGRCPDMKFIKNLTKKHKIFLIEDAAQAFLTKHKGKLAGTFGDFATISFHESKNISSGQGGALLINKKKFLDRAKIIRDKGTNKDDFLENKTFKYKWVDIGSSYTIGEVPAAFLNYQLDVKFKLKKKRMKLWKIYNEKLKNLSSIKKCYFPNSNLSDHNAHIYYLIIKNFSLRKKLEKQLSSKIPLYSHYEPLHSSLAGKIYGVKRCSLKNTEFVSKRLIRLPIHNNLTKKKIILISNLINKVINE